MINQLILTGNLGNQPEIFFGSEGDPVTSFSLAFKSGRDKTGWIKCVCFNKNAETAEKYLHSGARVAVVGYLNQSKWKTNEGEPRSSFEMIVNSIEFIKVNSDKFEN
jgi:single-strand DNA-binding protein